MIQIIIIKNTQKYLWFLSTTVGKVRVLEDLVAVMSWAGSPQGPGKVLWALVHFEEALERISFQFLDDEGKAR